MYHLVSYGVTNMLLFPSFTVTSNLQKSVWHVFGEPGDKFSDSNTILIWTYQEDFTVISEDGNKRAQNLVAKIANFK